MKNEKRLIDANVLSGLLDVEYRRKMELVRKGETHLNTLAEGLMSVAVIMGTMPTVDAVEVVHGRWIGEVGGYMWRQNCSVCNGPVYNKMKPYYNYCPYCGAKMDGGNEDGL